MFYLGIDISKDSFDIALLSAEQRWGGHFSNDAPGFAKLGRWLKKRQVGALHACMEATNRYWEALALFLTEEGHQVSVVNPKLIKRHAEATMQRNKTDTQDALTIADYCAKQQPDLWTPPSAARRELKDMARHLQALKDDRHRERNRQATGLSSPPVQEAIKRHIAFLDEQIAELEERVQQHIDQHPDLKRDKQLLQSIPGVGPTVAATFLAEVPHVSNFAQAGQVAAFAGLTPGEHHSGSSIHRPGKLVKWGNAHLRTVFYMPALSAHRHNAIIRNLKERLEARGKSKMTVIVAVMRKLMHLCYGVLKTRKPFDENHALNAQIA
jgi:transposase